MALAILDFLLNWDIATLILAAAVLTVVVLAASFGMASAWRRWKDGQRAKAAQAKGLPAPRTLPATGLRFQPRAFAAKLPRLGSKPAAADAPKPASGASDEPSKPKRGLPKVALPKFGRKKAE